MEKLPGWVLLVGELWFLLFLKENKEDFYTKKKKEKKKKMKKKYEKIRIIAFHFCSRGACQIKG